MSKALLPILLLASLSAHADNWRTYPLPSGGAVLLEVPAAWKDEVRQKDPRFAATIVLRPNRGKKFEVLFTPIPARGGQPPSMADVEASLIKGGAKHLATARQESIVLEKLEGEQVSGRFYRLTEKEPPPGEYPNVIGGGLVVGPLIASFTILFHDPEGGDAAEALRVLQSARFLSGHVGVYHASLQDIRLNVLIAMAAGLKHNLLIDQKTSYKIELGDFLLEADAVERDNIRIRIDGNDLDKARKLLTVLTMDLQRVR